MLIIPAIDIKDGKCVRLTQGIFEREKVYSEDPVAQALQWEEQGAQMLHVVDLDGARNGSLVNLEAIKKITQEINIPIQVGGGIRNKNAVEKLLSIGISRIILGTVALEDENELINILREYASQIAIALDTKNGELMKNGWLENSAKSMVITALRLENLGVQRFICTDTIKDGTLTEPNFAEITNLTKNVLASVIAGGGIANMNNIKQMKDAGVEGLIIGKALYERKIDLKEALEHVS